VVLFALACLRTAGESLSLDFESWCILFIDLQVIFRLLNAHFL
jgi:hypothetical protein